ncbi:GNAT family N-acetyltransferase [Salinivibrio kushneri]|uniref:GNAT family N-acetyltransferase n=1 Tax=Salinivibrio kushneri TaxID=1908198 RepID=UPI0009885146|nr:GNAT family N-acetyltransferase [Salinivibrio kushneri]OOE37207.1 GNAT family N-acetyltransferase [Salinivibrio kushneri]OOE55428.1 GNAT family N-acetyltransferase [Salinivibrio kushneri]
MIREITRPDFASFWPTFSAIIQAQETYALDPDMTQQDAFSLWCGSTLNAYAYVENDAVLGIYYIKPNGMGPSQHICNCGYMVASEARGKGIARLLCQHSQDMALERGFKAMQFNSVVSTNEVAVTLWQKLGFSIVGTIPRAYKHSQLGLVDSYVMYKWL